jgi:hypothetical protein
MSGQWYVVEVYPGCTDCGTEWGLGISRTSEADDFWEDYYGHVPVADFDDRFGQWGTRILDTLILKRLYGEETGDDDDLSEVRFPFEEFIDRGGLRRAFNETRRAAGRHTLTSEEVEALMRERGNGE